MLYVLCYFSSFRFPIHCIVRPSTYFLRKSFSFLHKKRDFSTRKIFTNVVPRMMAETKQNQWKNCAVEVFPSELDEWEIFAQKVGAINATSNAVRVASLFLYFGMKIDETLEENSVDSGSFFPLHFSSFRDSDFPIGPSPTSTTPLNRNEMTEYCLYNPHYSLFERRNYEVLQ